MLSASLDDIVRRNQELTKATRAQIAISRELREVSRNLIPTNADLREFLQESLVNVWSLRERWLEQMNGRSLWE